MSEQVINLSFLESFTRGDTTKMKKYIAMFISGAPDAIQQMRMLHNDSNWNQLRTVAHSLKPQLSYMGIDSVKETVLRIEEYAAEQKKPEVIAMMIEELDRTCKIAVEQLQNAIQKF
ncbi:MAG: Hpt domain-containing protein [Bacteroidetes bacterium]|nr:Hpt domain-containing protein [Bacteroidota bacterium]MBK8487290.1 Hpt domain-containing protein [Bacteroidota bacterium]